jgi:hypothetical protein
MLDIENQFKVFEELFIEIAINNVFVPVSKNKLQYKNFVIEKKEGRWQVIQQYKGYHRYIADTFLKITAFAICKLYDAQKLNIVDAVIKKDYEFEKNYIDSIYYKNTFKKTNSQVLKDTVIWRYEIAHSKAKQAKHSIDKEFYSLLR